MKKLLKNGKLIMAYIMAFAIVSASLFTGMAVNVSADNGCGGTIVEKWDAYENGKYVGWYNANMSGAGTEASPFIIDTAEKLAQLCRYGCNAGVYYKVADDIKAFDMNTVAGVDLTVNNISATDVKNAVAGKILGKVWFCDAPFKGNFDGNGVTIYGLCTGPAYYNQASFENGYVAGHNRGGLFPKIDAKTAVIKNVAIKNSYFKGDPAGAIFGETLGNGGSAIIENIIVANCYIDSSGGYISGVVGGYCLYDATTNTADKVKLNNCLVYDNVLYNKDGTPTRLIGTMEAYCDNGSGGKKQDTDGFKISNTIAIGCQIERSDSYWQKNAIYFTNCYTTEACATENTTITKLASANDAKGSAALNTLKSLNADDWFFNTTTYPEPSVFHDIKTQDNGDGTHSALCDCGLASNAVDHKYVDGVCSCGVAAKCGEIASVYSGTPDTSLEGAGTVANPYLVKTADEFAAVALGKIASTENTYFKVEGVDAFYINGGSTVANMTNANDVKAYFESNAATSNVWKSTGPFMGNFDGNGVTVYGVYSNHAGQYDYAALFPKISGHASIKNIAVKNSYISSFNKDGAIAALVGGTVYQGNGSNDMSVDVENVVVANNYIASSNSTSEFGASVLMGRFFEKHYATINNCIMYGNVVENAFTGVNVRTGMITSYPGVAADTIFNNIIAIGVTPWTVVENADGTYAHSGWYLSNIADGHFTNIYTDQSFDKLQAYNPGGNTDKALEKFNFNSLSADDMKGAAAVENITSLDSNWIFNANSYPELRVFHDDELSIEYADNNYAGHIESCSCGLTTPVVEHDYNNNYKCIECGFTCDHANADVNVSGGDCLTAATKTVVCSCGYENSSLNGNATGHTFINKAEVPSADCQTQGTAAHKYCSVCDKNYAVDADVMASFDTAISDEDLKLAPAAHTASKDSSGIIYNMNENTHSKVCSVCNEDFDTENHVGTFIADGANGHKGQCSVCMLDTSNEAAPHNFVGSTCEDCNWTCNDHDFVEGTVKNEGDCINNRVVATYCSICKIAGSDKVTTAPGHVEGEVQTENVVDPDCENDGSHDEVVYCTVCEAELSRTSVTDTKLGHTDSEVQIENVVAADCENDGSHDEVVYCTVCEEELSRTAVTDTKLGHKDGEVQTENVVAADCENDGSHDEVVYCTVCEEELSRTAVTDTKLGHTLTKVEEVEATYDSEGTKEYYICDCGEKFADADASTKVTDEELVIDKLVKEETDNSTDNNTESKPEGDTSDKSPETNDGLISVAMVAALAGAAFIATKKFRNK